MTAAGTVTGVVVEDWFKPMAYAIILLRQEGYPCVFYGDYKGIPTAKIKSKKRELDKLMKLRKNQAYGAQHDYFDDPNCIGWTREGDEEHKNSGMAVVISDGPVAQSICISAGSLRDVISRMRWEMQNTTLRIDEEGFGDFYVNRDAVAVWVHKENK